MLDPEQRQRAIGRRAIAGAIDEVSDSRGGGGLGDIPPVAQFAIGSRSMCGPGREDRLDAGRGAGKALQIIEVAVDNLGAGGAQTGGSRRVGVAGDRANGVAASEQDVDYDPEAAGRAGDQNALLSRCVSSWPERSGGAACRRLETSAGSAPSRNSRSARGARAVAPFRGRPSFRTPDRSRHGER